VKTEKRFYGGRTDRHGLQQ